MLRQFSTTLIFGAIASSSFAGISDGNFEALSGQWTAINGGVTNDYNGLLAPEGEYFGYGDSGAFAALLRNASEFFGPNETKVRFLYNFFTNETDQNGKYDDVFEMRLIGAGGASATYKIDSVQSAALDASNLKPSNFVHSTGWLMHEIDISGFVAANGSNPANVIFQVVDAGDGLFESGFGIDTIEAVPEPGTMAGLALGAAAFARRRRNAK